MTLDPLVFVFVVLLVAVMGAVIGVHMARWTHRKMFDDLALSFRHAIEADDPADHWKRAGCDCPACRQRRADLGSYDPHNTDDSDEF